jgi:hypothetical protein
VDVTLSETGRFASKNVTEASLEKEQVACSSSDRRIVEYVVSRQNDDGGYAFAQGLDSNAQDTCYGLATLSLLGSPFPNLERTVEWLCGFDLGSIYSYYYVGKALAVCNKHVDDRFRKFVSSLISSNRHFGSVDVYAEVSSEFEFTLMALELARMSSVKLNDVDEVKKWLLKYRNEDGGFGAYRNSNINSTYYAVASLSLLKASRIDLLDVIAFVRQCEKPYGGFTVIPRSLTPYMEHTYYGARTLDLLGENCRFPSQTIDFVLKCQRRNGGFARSDLGIATFENTFQAVSIMQRLAPI